MRKLSSYKKFALQTTGAILEQSWWSCKKLLAPLTMTYSIYKAKLYLHDFSLYFLKKTHSFLLGKIHGKKLMLVLVTGKNFKELFLKGLFQAYSSTIPLSMSYSSWLDSVTNVTISMAL